MVTSAVGWCALVLRRLVLMMTVWSDFSSFLLSDRRVERVAASVGSSSGATGWIFEVPIVSLTKFSVFFEYVVDNGRCSPCVVLVFDLSPKLNVSFLIVSFVCDYKGCD